jgi:hypothetical protein
VEQLPNFGYVIPSDDILSEGKGLAEEEVNDGSRFSLTEAGPLSKYYHQVANFRGKKH